jgi:hypothetical protein
LATATATAQYERAATGASEIVDPFLGTQVFFFNDFLFLNGAV